ncbi:hypothetical protein FHR76_001641 [Rhizobium sp. RAS22]|nr:hypothetical protein [Rhizobium sp. RAS22]
MMRNSISIVAVMFLGGCASTPSAETSTVAVKADKRNTPYDLSEVCLTEQGNPVSEGMVYKGKTCSKPHVISFQRKNILIWQ